MSTSRRTLLQLAGMFPLLPLLPAGAAETGLIFGIRLWLAPDHTRVVLDLDRAIDYTIEADASPPAIRLRLRQVVPVLQLDARVDDDPRLQAVVTHHRGEDLEIELRLRLGVRARAFLLSPNESYGHRLVVDLHALTLSQPESSVASPSPELLTIAIDAGHGGEDPGAVGPKGGREKQVVLQIAQRLQRLVTQEPGMRAVMIRSGDYYVSLNGRVRKARRARADLLLSIHADGFRRPSAHGASVFTLSNKRASSEMARWLVQQENRADRIGGVDQEQEQSFAYALRDMERAANARVSGETAQVVLQALKRITRLHGDRVHKGSFAVLKATDFPSLLIETGFITNPREERLLRSRGHQQKLAEATMAGVRNFAREHPLAGKERIAGGREIAVHSGDTLSSIARAHGLSLSRLRQLNPGVGDLLRVGQKLRIQ